MARVRALCNIPVRWVRTKSVSRTTVTLNLPRLGTGGCELEGMKYREKVEVGM